MKVEIALIGLILAGAFAGASMFGCSSEPRQKPPAESARAPERAQAPERATEKMPEETLARAPGALEEAKSSASAASAASAATQSPPAAFNRCKTCHGADARGRGSIGPDLTLSELTLDQWIMQTRFGSKWDGKPPKRKGFEKRIMTKQMASDEEVKEIYKWVKGSR